jgi:hypothetical protein
MYIMGGDPHRQGSVAFSTGLGFLSRFFVARWLLLVHLAMKRNLFFVAEQNNMGKPRERLAPPLPSYHLRDLSQKQGQKQGSQSTRNLACLLAPLGLEPKWRSDVVVDGGDHHKKDLWEC